MNPAPGSGPTIGNNANREYAERFLKYFHDLAPNPGSAALNVQAYPDDWKVLSRLAQGYCVIAARLDEPFGVHWTKRKKNCARLLRLLSGVSEAATKFLSDQRWLETRSHFCVIGEEDDDHERLSALDEDARQVGHFLEGIEYLRKRLEAIDQLRKPMAADDKNFYLFLMATFLRFRGATIETAICQEIADYVNAHLDASQKAHKPLERSDVRQRIGRFPDRNATLARSVETDVLAYVQRETDITPITKIPQS